MPLSEMILLAKGKKKLSEYRISWLRDLMKEINIALIKNDIESDPLTDENTGDDLIETFESLPEEVRNEIISNTVFGKPVEPEDLEVQKKKIINNAIRLLSYCAVFFVIVFSIAVTYVAVVNADKLGDSFFMNFITAATEVIKVIISGGAS